MKQFLKYTLLLLVLLLPATAAAHDFEVDGIYYKINGSEVTVTYKGYSYSQYSNEYFGDIIIPAVVYYNGTTYTVTTIGNGAFYSCTGLTSVTIPNSVTSIGSAFYGCSGLTSVRIPNSVTDIVSSAFSSCTNLTSIIVASGNRKYDSRDNCNAIIETSSNTLILGCKNTSIPNSVTSIGNGAFSQCSGLTSVSIPNSVTSIGNSAFSNCHDLISVTIPNSVITIGNSAFRLCTSLTSIVIPNSVTSISDDSFYGCSGLTGEITIPNSVISIGEYAFSNCSGINCVNFGDSITVIGRCAFLGCTSLTSITIPNTVTTIGGYAFKETIWYNNQPDGLVYAGLVAYEYKGEMPENTSIAIKDGTLSISDYAFSGCTGLSSITIPNSVTSIGNSAFSGCTGLTSIDIPDSVTSLPGEVFCNCTSLTSVHIGSSVGFVDIGYPMAGEPGAFDGCTSLEEITVASDNPKYDSRDNCNAIIETSSNSLILGSNNTVIPNSVTSIGAYAFMDRRGLVSLKIPNSITSIGSCAFLSCNSLNDIYSYIVDPSAITMGYTVFLRYPNDFSDRTLYVPVGSLAAYQTDTKWSVYFGSIVEGAMPGDLDANGKVSIADVVELIDLLLRGDVSAAENPAADVNGNGIINIADVVELIDQLLN